MKVVRFAWKFAHMVSWKCWFRIRTYIFENLTPKCINFVDIKFKIFWANFGEKSQYCLFCLTIGTHGIFGRVDTKSEVRFSKCRPENPFLSKFGLKKHFLFILIWDLTSVLGHISIFDFIFYNCFTFCCCILQAVVLVWSAYISTLSWIYIVLVLLLSKFIFT